MDDIVNKMNEINTVTRGKTCIDAYRRHRYCLDVGDGCGTSKYADVGRKRRFQPRFPLFPLDRLDEGGFFAADIRACSSLHEDVEVVAGVAGVLADQPGLVSLGYGDLHVGRLVVKFTAYVDVSGAGSHGAAGDQAALHELVRIVAQNLAVLTGPWLALVAVNHQILGPTVGRLVHEGPLHPGGKAGPATASQARNLDFIDDPVGTLVYYFLGLVPIAAAHRALQPPVMSAVQVREDAILIGQGPSLFLREEKKRDRHRLALVSFVLVVLETRQGHLEIFKVGNMEMWRGDSGEQTSRNSLTFPSGAASANVLCCWLLKLDPRRPADTAQIYLIT